MVVQHPRLSTREQVRWKHGLRKLAQFARVLTPQLQFAKAGFTLACMSLDFDAGHSLEARRQRRAPVSLEWIHARSLSLQPPTQTFHCSKQSALHGR